MIDQHRFEHSSPPIECGARLIARVRGRGSIVVGSMFKALAARVEPPHLLGLRRRRPPSAVDRFRVDA